MDQNVPVSPKAEALPPPSPALPLSLSVRVSLSLCVCMCVRVCVCVRMSPSPLPSSSSVHVSICVRERDMIETPHQTKDFTWKAFSTLVAQACLQYPMEAEKGVAPAEIMTVFQYIVWQTMTMESMPLLYAGVRRCKQIGRHKELCRARQLSILQADVLR